MSRQSLLRVFYGGVLLPSIHRGKRRDPGIPNCQEGLFFSSFRLSPRVLRSGPPRRFILRGVRSGASPIRKRNMLGQSRGRASVFLSILCGVLPNITRIQSLRRSKLPISSSVLFLVTSIC